ncbi:hypothetical protein SAMN05444266_103326 [Chitinophaga jiangningensis]|uniref:Uncharacterized protein n=1 Tax=Chitinophaga jiangningensis TaxID=1419482 RepID=A0A1M7ALL3_9BACT|nr:hypothetical protein SAMN05444266_103326 [Chitinophaga jiangningensis]
MLAALRADPKGIGTKKPLSHFHNDLTVYPSNNFLIKFYCKPNQHRTYISLYLLHIKN